MASIRVRAAVSSAVRHLHRQLPNHSPMVITQKQDADDFWNTASCGEDHYFSGSDRAACEARARHTFEPYILEFVQFGTSVGERVLEIGVGLGADHQPFAEAGANLFGIDLTERAVAPTTRRMAAFGLSSQLHVGDTARLTFPGAYFDRVYSWGVLNRTPETPRALSEVGRGLKPGGRASVIIYDKWSLIGVMLRVRHALLGLRPWMSLNDVYSRYLQNPGDEGVLRYGGPNSSHDGRWLTSLLSCAMVISARLKPISASWKCRSRWRAECGLVPC